MKIHSNIFNVKKLDFMEVSSFKIFNNEIGMEDKK
jgi:hypothetical protein